MKVFVVWVWFLVIGVAFMFLATSASAAAHDTSLSADRSGKRATTQTRKLKEENYQMGTSSVSDNINLNDYHPLDPPPSSGVITSGPIEHGSPLNPHIPKPKPGSDSNNGTCPPTPSPIPSRA